MRERGGLEVEAPLRSPGLPAGHRVGGGSGAHRRARGISRIMGGQDGARARKGTMTVAIKRPETIIYEEKIARNH